MAGSLDDKVASINCILQECNHRGIKLDGRLCFAVELAMEAVPFGDYCTIVHRLAQCIEVQGKCAKLQRASPSEMEIAAACAHRVLGCLFRDMFVLLVFPEDKTVAYEEANRVLEHHLKHRIHKLR